MNEDIQALLEPLVSTASGELSADHSFDPSGATLDADGEINMLRPVDSGGDPERQVAVLKQTFAELAEKGEIRACAFSLNVTVQDERLEETDAILVSAEASDGSAFDVFFPYTDDGESLELGEPFASRRDAEIFAAD